MGIEDFFKGADDLTGIVIDANNFLYSTYHVLNHRVGGTITEGFIAYSMINQIRGLILKLSKEHGVMNPVVFVVWDGEGSRDVRQKIHPAYKGNRKPTPSLIHSTRDQLKEHLGNISSRLNMDYPGIEADDLMYLLAKEEIFYPFIDKWIICSRDEDMLQIIDERTKVWNNNTKKLWSVEDVQEKYGFDPQRIVMYKALVGDTSDNWKGVSKIGEKTAAGLLCNDDSMELVMGSVADKLSKGKDYELKMEQFCTGLALCELPIEESLNVECIKYLYSMFHNDNSKDWTGLWDHFEVQDINKCQFRVGSVRL